ncbi:unnamed protein product [Periconia digitata]|uniref:Uncharacterized protein n=1 Tax=Periconia digitata TaxID=1303443 RepID=A0A9W4U315_9PLEO|nr:unnamed protein product [Periconia digitata]
MGDQGPPDRQPHCQSSQEPPPCGLKPKSSIGVAVRKSWHFMQSSSPRPGTVDRFQPPGRSQLLICFGNGYSSRPRSRHLNCLIDEERGLLPKTAASTICGKAQKAITNPVFFVRLQRGRELQTTRAIKTRNLSSCYKYLLGTQLTRQRTAACPFCLLAISQVAFLDKETCKTIKSQTPAFCLSNLHEPRCYSVGLSWFSEADIQSCNCHRQLPQAGEVLQLQEDIQRLPSILGDTKASSDTSKSSAHRFAASSNWFLLRYLAFAI